MDATPSTRRTTAIAAAVALVTSLVVGAASFAVASHQWPDVDTGNAFHEAIDNFSDAGCATGFPDGTFRGRDPVRRQQMARFINACGGRVETATISRVMPTITGQNLLSVTLESGAVAGVGGFVLVLADYQATGAVPNGGGCQIQMRLRDGGTTLQTTYLDLVANPLTVEDVNGAAHWLRTIGPNQSKTFTVNGFSSSCGVTVTGEISLTALYVPFGGEGRGGS